MENLLPPVNTCTDVSELLSARITGVYITLHILQLVLHLIQELVYSIIT